jgi:beta-phosphoglucomutase family hydrolase
VIAPAKCVIFDMDGVLANTAPFHIGAWEEFVRRRNISIDQQFFWNAFGLGNDEIFPPLFNRKMTKEEIDSLTEEKESLFRDKITGKIRPFPGVVELIKSLKTANYALAVGSSAIRLNVETVIHGLGLGRYFTCVVTGDEVTKAKPEPDIFLKAADLCKIPPAQCIVIEDSFHGVTAANRAGMKCIAVTNSHPADKLGAANLVVTSLADISVKTCDGLLG